MSGRAAPGAAGPASGPAGPGQPVRRAEGLVPGHRTVPSARCRHAAAARNLSAGRPWRIAAIRAGRDAATDRAGRLTGALRGYIAVATGDPAPCKLMFIMGDPGDFPELAEAALGSFAVLEKIAEGLDWPHAGKVPGNANTQMMIRSLAHGLSDLAINGRFEVIRGPLPPPDPVFPGFGDRG